MPWGADHAEGGEVITGKSRREIGKCRECGASYYEDAQIGKDCEVQYCRGIVARSHPVSSDALQERLRSKLARGRRGLGF